MIPLIPVSSETVMFVKSVNSDTCEVVICFISDDVLLLGYVGPGV